jgi:hypothetical protein
MSMERSMQMQPVHGDMSQNGHQDGHLYTQTNELRNAVVHYRRAANGTITEVDRVSTGGSGSGVFKPISGQESAPNAFEGAGSVLLTPFGALFRGLLAASGGTPARRRGDRGQTIRRPQGRPPTATKGSHMSLSDTVLTGPGGGRTVTAGHGSTAELKLAGEQSGGDWAVVEWRVRAGDEPPIPHAHARRRDPLCPRRRDHRVRRRPTHRR